MDTNKEIFLNNRFEVNKSEIELVLNEQAFKCEDAFIINNQQMINMPSFIFDNQELQSVLKNHDLLNKKASQLNHLSKTELRSEKSNLKEELEMLYRGCKKIFDAVGGLLRHEIKAEYSFTIQNDNSKIKKIEALDSLIQKAHDLVAFFGIKPDYKSASGLIYGTDVDRCLYAIRKYEALNVILQENINDINDYRTDQRDINLKKLVELQNLAIPKAKDYVIIQHALSTLSESKPQAGEDNKISIVRKTAERFKANSKNPNSPYTVDNYVFVMQLAKDYPKEDNVAELVRMIRKHPKCPKILSDKGLKDTTKPERNWIKEIDTALGIERKLNTAPK